MTDTILVNKFLNDLFSIKYSLKNSTGINRTNNEINKVINNHDDKTDKIDKTDN